jgi:2'-5' RNA ligase
MPFRSSYLQFHVPLDRLAGWYRALRTALNGVKGVRWQPGFFHITAVFINDKIDTAEADKVAGILGEELLGMSAPTIGFDTLGSFTTQGGRMHVVYLTASQVPGEWADLIDRVRSKLSAAGYHLGPYQLHVTLARVPAGSIDLESLRALIAPVDVPMAPLTLTKADYRFYQEYKWAVREWTLPAKAR